MEPNQKITYGILGVLTMFVATLGGTIYLSPDELENAYICTANEEIGFFERFSSTMKTGYWAENGEEQSKVCRNGFWVKLKTYAEQNNIPINVLLNQNSPRNVVPSGTGGTYSCNQKECVRVG